MIRTMKGSLLLMLIAMGIAGCGSKREAPRDELAPVVIGPENIVVVAETTLATGPTVSGALTAEREARVRSELGGSVLQVYAEPGQAVKAGQVLAQIEPQTAREQAAFASALVRSLENDLRLQNRNLERDRRLAEAGAVSPRTVEADSLAVSQAEAALAEARARRVVADRALDRSTVRAPFAGIVSARAASVGDVVRDGTELFTIVDPSSMRLEAQVPAAALKSLQVGSKVQFTISGVSDVTLTGTVSRIYPSVDPATGQVKVLVTIPNPGQRLIAGLYVDGRVVTEQRRGLTVPQGAVDERGTRPQVALLKGGRLERVNVTLGLADRVAELVEVTSGVAAGDTVVLGAARSLPAGTPARVRAAAEQQATAVAK